MALLKVPFLGSVLLFYLTALGAWLCVLEAVEGYWWELWGGRDSCQIPTSNCMNFPGPKRRRSWLCIWYIVIKWYILGTRYMSGTVKWFTVKWTFNSHNFCDWMWLLPSHFREKMTWPRAHSQSQWLAETKFGVGLSDHWPSSCPLHSAEHLVVWRGRGW